jgi:hypothetical protein
MLKFQSHTLYVLFGFSKADFFCLLLINALCNVGAGFITVLLSNIFEHIADFEICLISFKKGVVHMINSINCINVFGIKLNNQDHASVLNLGPNQFIDQFVSYKRNQGVGDPGGDVSPINIPISWIVDPDLTDSNTAKNSVV